ncbi:Sterol O-acyltransferase 1 [Labeo rohita]|uniref:O-acyltransferase n=1 Tax=Labeo rohita TaxID=84645 RepID=A0ABQ8MM61_LABRO|nr:Sterol O-acyltransferase 1 [Labeo rohita]
MSTYDTGNAAVRRSSGRTESRRPTENGSVSQHDAHTDTSDITLRKEDVERMKAELIQNVQSHLNDLLERALSDSLQSLSRNTQTHSDHTRTHDRHKPDQGKVFVARCSLLDELFEISHIRTINHMFIAALFLFIISTLAVDYIDQGRLVLDFDLFYYAFGQLGTVVWAWTLMFVYTLLGPYYILSVWASLHHSCSWRTCVSAAAALTLCAAQMSMLGIFPVYIVLHYQLPPASRFIIILEQIRFVMKSYSFIRETMPAVLRNTPQKGQSLRYPSLSSYLYFLFCPTLIYREVYPRNPNIRWDYVGMNFLKILACLFYLYFILDWWNSTSFANYYRTWNIVVHDWLYYYCYRDFLRLTGHKLRSVATLSVFAVSAFVHEYTFTMGFGFFYPVMFCTFAGIGVVFNFALNDKRKSPVCNIIMWTSLFIGQGIHVCLYCLEWYAQIQCPRTGVKTLMLQLCD